MGLLDLLPGRKPAKPLVLIVDDDPSVRSLERDALEAMGCEVIEAANGREALALAKARKPRLILLDVMMPEMNGQQALAILKAGPETAPIPVIMVTAEQKGGDVEYAFQNGAAGYVIKPIRVANLREKVLKVLPLPGA